MERDHTFFHFSNTVIDVLGLKLPKRNIRCADCHRKIKRGKGRAADDGAGESLLRAEDDSDEDVEDNAYCPSMVAENPQCRKI